MKKEMNNAISRKDFLKGTAASALTLAATSMMGGLAFAEEAPAEEAAPEAVLTAEPVVQIKSGAIRGYMDDNTYAFLGVPYATAERFAFPQEVEPWEGVRNTQAYGFVCPIPAATSVGADEMVWPHRYWIEGEQCMNLNIWTQSIDPSAKKPVYVYIHGGGFNNGSSIEGAAQEGKMPEHGLPCVGNEAAEIAVARQDADFPHAELHKIFDDPAADQAVVGEDEHGHYGVQPSAEGEEGAVL